jgi:transposase InsO family protein
LSARSGMMDGHVPAVRLPPRRQRVLLAAVGRPGRGLEGHGTPSATPPAPRAPTAAGTQTTIDAGRPGADRCAGTCDPQGAAGGIAAGGDSRHGDALASRLAAPPVGRQVPRGMLRSPCYPTRHPSPGSPAGQGEPGLGIPENPRRTRRHGHPDRPSTVWKILTRAGIDPAPRRAGRTWAQFLRSQAEAIIAADFFTVDLLNGAQVHCLAVVEHATRRVRIIGCTAHPTAAWVTQQARNLLIDLDGRAETIKFLLRDRDAKFAAAFDAVLQSVGIRTIKTPVRAPRANAVMERWIGSCRGEILDRTLIWNLPHLRRVLAEYEDHYNRHRPHRTRQHASPLRGLPEPANLDHLNVQRRDRLGGIINEYTQVA